MDKLKHKILLVEDDGALLNILTDIAVQKNYQIIKASDGEEALKEVIAQRPEIILLDLLLPKMDGYQVLEHIRHHPDPDIANTKVIVLSNLWSDKDILRAQSLTVDDYYVKSNVRLDDVFNRVHEILSA